MKTQIKLIAALMLLSTFNARLSIARAQGTDFTYQGRLDNAGAPANGSFDIAFTLYATNTTGSVVAGPVTNPAVAVSNGLFTTTVNFGPGIFSGTNYWLELAVSTNGADVFSTLAPRQALTPTPYAIFAAGANAAGLTGTIAASNVGGTYGNPVDFNNGENSFDGSFYGAFYGGSFIGGTFTGSFIGNGSGLSDVWHNVGDLGTTPGVNFLGTLDNQPLIIKVNGQQAFEFVPTTATPNVVGGSGANFVAAGLSGATIAGGGQIGGTNRITGAGSGSFIGGGENNQATSFNIVIGGGANNSAFANASTLTGGSENIVSGDHDFIGGGQHNTTTNGAYDVISGGFSNTNMGIYSFIGGGYGNLNDGAYSFIGAGVLNSIGFANESVISGGFGNTNNGLASAIGGGFENSINSSSLYATIGGGNNNLIAASASGVFGGAVIGGGSTNTIQAGSSNSVVAGGMNNNIQPFSFAATISGGYNNTVVGPAAVIAGGHDNIIQTNAGPSTISGGYQNTIQSNNAANIIAGGVQNQIQPYATYSIIGGGVANTIMGNSNFWASTIDVINTISGGGGNQIQANGGYSVIGGGVLNIIGTNSGWGTIGGGAENVIGTNATYATIAGGQFNSILGNATNGTIGGGTNNQVGGIGATVPGGFGNLAGGLNSFAAGTLAQATNDGSFVLTDDIGTNFYSTTSNQLSARFSGGVRIVTGGAGMTVDGQPVVSGGSAGFWKTTGNAGTSPGANFVGTTDGQPLLLKAPFVGVGRTNAISSIEFFGVEAPVPAGNFGGMFVDTSNANAMPFYGYSLGHAGAAYHYVDGTDTNKWHLVTTFGICITATQDGKVGIDTATPDATLTVNGTADKPGGGSWNVFSDARLKDVGANFTDGLDALERIQPVTYHYKGNNPLKLPSQPEYVGVIAQQVQKAVPEAVQQSSNGYLTVNNDPIIWTMVNAIKELNRKVDEKDAENARLKQQLAELKDMVEQLARARGK